MSIDLVVNGRAVQAAADPQTPLLTVLRDELGLLGTRFGCGLGLCGACFVRLGDAVVASCDTPLWQADGSSVTTVEGLVGADGEPHPVQRAILDRQAAQCGFCISGVVVRAASLLEQDPSPDEAAVCAALERNLCRCGVQRRIIEAVVSAGAGATQATGPRSPERDARAAGPAEGAQQATEVVDEPAQREGRSRRPAGGQP